MAHYTIEVCGGAPIDWRLLRAQRDTFTGMIAAPNCCNFHTSEEHRAIEGVRNLLDVILDTHEDGPHVPREAPLDGGVDFADDHRA